MARMKPIQIHLSDSDVAALDAAGARSGASRSELIRRAIRDHYGADGEYELPHSIGIVDDGRLEASRVGDWLRENWDPLA